MKLINGRKGRFFGCPKWNKGKGCKYTENIETLPLDVVYFDFYKFLNDDPSEYVLDLIRVSNVNEYIKELELSLENRKLNKADLQDGSPVIGKISGLLDYLMKSNLSFDLAKLTYFFHRLNDGLREKHAYFLNHETGSRYYREYDITTAVYNGWDNFSSYLENTTASIEFEQPLVNMNHLSMERVGYMVNHKVSPIEGARVDVAAYTMQGNYLIFEFKGPTGGPIAKGRQAVNQIIGYMHELTANGWDVSTVKPYILVRGYSGIIFDKDLSYCIKRIGYVIQDGEIMFIPWD